jgi:beta-N-acetylhexosaminidase
MTSLWQPGQLLFAGFKGTELPRELAELLAQGRMGGVILFARNIVDPEQVRALTAALHAAAPPEVPVLLAIDQEGGRVQRLRAPWTEWPPMRQLGERDEPETTAAVARRWPVSCPTSGSAWTSRRWSMSTPTRTTR